MCERPWDWAHRQFARPHLARLARVAVAASSMLEFSSTLGTKLVCGWIGGIAGRTNHSARDRLGFAFSCRNLATNQCVQISCRLDVFDFLKDNGGFSAHFGANLPIILFGQ